MKKIFFKLALILMTAVFVFGTVGAADADNANTDTNADQEQTALTDDSADGVEEDLTVEAEQAEENAAEDTQTEEELPEEEILLEEQIVTEEYPAPYTMAWLDKYAPGSVAPFEEQVGDNGEYPEEVIRPANDTYELVVDYTNQCVYAFSKDDDGELQLERVMMCTTGGNGHWTPEGEYEMGTDYKRFGFFPSFNCYAQYWSQMWASFYFHSILYSDRDADSLSMSSYRNLGTPGSHGCIRLLVPDARWIYENCAPGTKCTVTTDYKKNPALKNALKNGYEGATDYVAPEEEA